MTLYSLLDNDPFDRGCGFGVADHLRDDFAPTFDRSQLSEWPREREREREHTVSEGMSNANITTTYGEKLAFEEFTERSFD